LAKTQTQIFVGLFGGGVRVCGVAGLGCFWCSFTVILILTRVIAVSKHKVIFAVITTFKLWFVVK